MDTGQRVYMCQAFWPPCIHSSPPIILITLWSLVHQPLWKIRGPRSYFVLCSSEMDTWSKLSSSKFTLARRLWVSDLRMCRDSWLSDHPMNVTQCHQRWWQPPDLSHLPCDHGSFSHQSLSSPLGPAHLPCFITQPPGDSVGSCFIPINPPSFSHFVSYKIIVLGFCCLEVRLLIWKLGPRVRLTLRDSQTWSWLIQGGWVKASGTPLFIGWKITVIVIW